MFFLTPIMIWTSIITVGMEQVLPAHILLQKPLQIQIFCNPIVFFVEDGSYARIQNIQIGYTIMPATIMGIKNPKARFYVASERPLTLTNYKGFTPEIGGPDPNDMGVDNTVYPMQAIYSFGMK